MRTTRGKALALLTVLTVGAGLPGAAGATAPPGGSPVSGAEIQARIDRQLESDDRKRQSIQGMLDRSDVRDIAEGAGLDVERARASLATLSGAELEAAAAQAGEFNDLVGGADKIVLSTTAVIIILLLLILLVD
jgi:hypothetical protein